MSEVCLSNSFPLTVQFGGGAELLFNKTKKHDLILPQQDNPWTLKALIHWLKDNLLTEKPELFVQGDTVRPGILVLVNDQDWELLVEISESCEKTGYLVGFVTFKSRVEA